MEGIRREAVVGMATSPDGLRVFSSRGNELLIYLAEEGITERFRLPLTGVVRVLGALETCVIVELLSQQRAKPSFETVALALDDKRSLAQLGISGGEVRWEGTQRLWGRLPRLHVARLAEEGGAAREVLVVLGAEAGQVEVIEVPKVTDLDDDEWPLALVLAPDGRTAVLGRNRVGRSLVSFDLLAREVQARVSLPGPVTGDPPWAQPCFRPGTWELWLACGDAIVLVDVSSRRLLGTRALGMAYGDTIGDFAFDSGFKRGVLTLLESQTVVGFDAQTLEVIDQVRMSERLDGVHVWDDGRFVGQVWDSHRFLEGRLAWTP
jgi:hypothetical protein